MPLQASLVSYEQARRAAAEVADPQTDAACSLALECPWN